jgi:Integrase core domain
LIRVRIKRMAGPPAIKTLKQEQIHGRDWRDLDALRAELTTFFEITYNHQRLHSALNYQTPAAFEQQLRSVVNVEASTKMAGARELTAPSPQTPLPGLQSLSQQNCPWFLCLTSGVQFTRLSPHSSSPHSSGYLTAKGIVSI